MGTFAAKAGEGAQTLLEGGILMLWFWAYLVPIPLVTISVQCNRDLVVLIQSHQALSHSLRIPGVCSLDKHNDSRVLAVQFCACYPELFGLLHVQTKMGNWLSSPFLISGISILPPLEKVNFLTTYNLKEHYCAQLVLHKTIGGCILAAF